MRKLFTLFIPSIICISNAPVTAQGEFSSGTISVGVVVTDLEKSIDFYTNVMGMVNTGGFEVQEDFARRSGLSNGVPFEVTVMKLIDAEEATQWKLLSFGNKAGHKTQKYIQDDTGMQYVTVFVKSLAPFLERIKKHHVELLGETPTALTGDDHFVFIQDPDGTFIELIGPM